MTRQLMFAQVHPPRPLAAEALEALLVRLASDPTQAPMVFEARSRSTKSNAQQGNWSTGSRVSSVSYWLGTTSQHLRWLRRTCHDLLPGLVIESVPQVDVAETGFGGGRLRRPVTHAARVMVRPRSLALAVDRPEQVSTALLSALNQKLMAGEELVLQLVLGPRRSPHHRRDQVADPAQPLWSQLTYGTRAANTEVRRQHETRILGAGLAACIRFGVTASDRDRRRRLLAGLLGGLSTAKAPGTFVRLRPESARALNAAAPPLLWEFTPAAVELVGLLAWPLGEGDLPGLPPMHPRRLPPSRQLQAAARVALADGGRVFGISDAPGPRVPVGVSAVDGLHHLVATGPTGSGKSTALLHLIAADVAANRPVLVLDPKRQLIDDIIERAIPEHRISDVVILDPSEQRVAGFNPLDIGHRDPDVVVDGLLAVFAAVFEDGWGPRTQDMIHSGLLTLARVGQHRTQPFTLLDLPRLFTDPGFRRSVIGHVADDPGLGQFWAWYESQTPQAQAAALAAPLNKLRQYLLRPSLRRVLGQPTPRFRLRDVFGSSKIVLVPLNEALIGPITAKLLGGLILAEAWSATLERAAETEPMSRPASVFVDEVQNYLHLPTSIDAALNASRSLGVAWHVAHQFRAQLPPQMSAAVDSNARNKIVFRPLDPRDAAAAARQAGELEPLDFMTLGQYQAYATLVAAGASQPWCSLTTLPPPPRTDLGGQIRAHSRQTYGAAVPSNAPPASSDQSTPSSTGAPTASATEPDQPVGRKRKPRRTQASGDEP